MGKFKKKTEQAKRKQLLGEALCDFVNAETTDEACFAILTGIQKFFDFGPSFIEEVRKVFPAIGNIESPPKDLMEEDDAKQERIACEKKVLSSLREKLGPDIEVKYNSDDHSFKLYTNESIGSRRSLRSLFFRRPSEPHPLSDLLMPPFNSKEFSASDPNFLELVEDESVIDEILDLGRRWTRVETISLHGHIQWEQEYMRKLFDSLLRGGKNFGMYFAKYLGNYNELSKSMERRANPLKTELRDGRRGPYPISEEGYLSTKLWHYRMVNDLSYCLIEFLVSEDKKNLTENKKNLKKCDVCSKFLVHPTRKRCPGECTRIAAGKYDAEYKQDGRWENFVRDVKEKCKTPDDLNLDDNRKLLARARHFRFGESGVIERLKKEFKKDSESHP